ncbi:hypothetical protein FEF65_02990 [Mariprofundus erugo]|uniref:Uncharacterized protein n=1 Tax=Mariprofundus erugo TaxID=2528639 RepID=A0A5R9GXW7_9PROT|nr:hypothetical protein [Mariprofundus erugo]TLS68682.1 hypothetical protein FEF65_02990 [Mariprofundus erugo]
MNVLRKEMPSEEGQIMLDTLKQAVSHALERKRRLGQYAVIWKDGQPVRLGEEQHSENQKSK